MTIIVGTPVGKFLNLLLSSFSEITSCEFLEVRLPKSVEFRPGASPALKGLAEEVRRIVGEGDSFTETLMRLGAEAGVADAVLDVAQYHQPLEAATRSHHMAPCDVTETSIRKMCQVLDPNSMLVLTSQVDTTNGIRQIPMADFKIKATSRNHESALAAARRLGSGHLLVSGSSYHYYGNFLLDDSELRDWLLRAQLLSRYVDTRWVTHQLIEGRCALRVSPGGGRQAAPFVLGGV